MVNRRSGCCINAQTIRHSAHHDAMQWVDGPIGLDDSHPTTAAEKPRRSLPDRYLRTIHPRPVEH